MKQKDLTEANRAAWNEVAPYHRKTRFADLLEKFKTPDYSYLDDLSTKILQENIGIAGKDIAHLCCNNGRELLSLKNLGAGRCVGFDISDEFIADAQKLALAGRIDCEFVRSDVYDISQDYNNSFDMVYFTIGGLCWLPDLARCFEIVKRLLRTDGWVFIYDIHPVAEMFETADEVSLDKPPQVRNSYFKSDPFMDTDGLDYMGGVTYDSKPNYSHLHQLSTTMQALLDNGFAIRYFDEYPHDISNGFAHLQELGFGVPLSYILIAQLS